MRLFVPTARTAHLTIGTRTGPFLMPARARKEPIMAEGQVQEQIQDEPQAEPQGEAQEPDWKALARKWEARAKKNDKAQAELEALKQAQMTEQEKAIARAEAAEKRVAEMEAEKQHLADIKDVAKETGVPEELLMYCKDREAMESFAAEYSKNQIPIHSAPSAVSSRLVNGAGPKKENRDIFAEFAEKTFNL